MPQMMPLFWLMMSLFLIILLILINNFIYFFYTPSLYKNKYTPPLFTTFPAWLWLW